MTQTEKDMNMNGDSLALHYLVREPAVQSEKNRGILLLHGVGSNEEDLFGLANYFPDDFYIISARGQFSLGAGRFAWYNVDFSTGKPVIDALQELSSRDVIMRFISQVRTRYGLDEVYVGGFSQGAIMSYTVGLRNPRIVQGIIAFSGRMLEEVRNSLSTNPDLKKVRVFVAHGVQDATLPIHYAREVKTSLEKAGVPLRYHEYQMGHQINEMVLTNLNSWLSESP